MPSHRAAALLVFALGPAFAQVALNLTQEIPTYGLAGEPSTPIRLIGTGFVNGTRVSFNGTDRFITSLSPTTLSFTLGAADLATAGTFEIRASNPDGSVSNALTFTVNNAVPNVTRMVTGAWLSPSRIRAGSSSTTITLSGEGFSRASSIYWNGQQHSTAFVAPPSGSQLFLQITASALDLAKPGSVSLQVHNPQPGGGESANVFFLISVGKQVSDLVWDQSSSRILMSIPASPQTPDSNTIVALDPATGLLSQGVTVRNNPGRLAISGDQTNLFVALNGEASLGKYSLPSLSLDAKYPNETVTENGVLPGPVGIEDLVVVPNRTDVAAASLIQGSPAGVAIYDSNGRRPKTTPIVIGSNLLGFGSDPAILYGLNTQGGGFHRMLIDSSGVAVDQVVTDTSQLFSSQFLIAHDNAFTGSGYVLNPDTGRVLRQLPPSGWLTQSAPTDLVYYSDANGLTALNSSTFEVVGRAASIMEQSDNIQRFLTWGNHGLAFSNFIDVFIISDPGLSQTRITLASQPVNAASFQPSLAPGMIATLYGSGIGPAQSVVAEPSGDSYPTVLSGTSVFFDGIPAPIIYAAQDQVSVIVPYAVAGRSLTQVQVTNSGSLTQALYAGVLDASPAIFTINSSGSGQGAIVNQDGTINSKSNPASIGSIIVVYATGEGQTDPPGIDGKLATGGVLPKPLLPVMAKIGGVDAIVQYAGAAPQAVAGLMQVNLVVPATVTPGPQVPVLIQVGNMTTPAGVTVAIQ